MAKGTLKLEGLTSAEYRAANAAMKLVRGDVIKNAYLEGWRDGAEAFRKQYRGDFMEGEGADWNKSHAKALLTE